MAPLYRAITFVQMDEVAVAVAKHLNFDVSWALHVFFNQHRVVVETVFRFPLTRGQGIGEVFCALDDAHALAATTRTGFDQHRKAHGLRFLRQQRRVLVCTVVAGHQWHTGFFHQLLGRGFQAHGLNRRRGRPNEHHPRLLTGIGEVGVFA